MKKKAWIFGCLVSLNALAADTIVFSDPKKAVQVDPHHPRFTLILKANPTTGYTWVLRRYNSRLLKALGHAYHASNTKLVGAPGYVTFQFQALPPAFAVPQMTRLTLEYVRPWEGHAPQNTAVTFTVVTNK